MTRRDFVKAGAVLSLAAATTGCAASEKKPAVATPSKSYGGSGTMSGRILVGYATRTGSTVGVAEAIGAVLGERGFAVDVKPLRDKPSLSGYEGVVLGSAINGGAWLPEAMAFVESNRAVLTKVPVAVFCVHAMNTADNPKAAAKRTAYLDKVRAVFSPADEAFFAGKGPDAKDTSLIARWAFRAFGGDTEGDARDWDKIRAWARAAKV